MTADLMYYHRDHLDNTCAVWNATADSVVQRTLYYASGMPMAGSTGQPYQPYKYNGKEFVTEYGYDEYDSQARWYYPAVMRTATIDPLSEKYYATSPYVWCANNPVISVDPLGLAPIYAPDGTFLGTDNSGLQGLALIMEKASFTQGMSNEEAMKYNLGLAGLENQTAIDRYTSHFDGLSSRPDYDGYLTKSEADAWWNGKSGQPLYVDQSKINLPGITTATFNNQEKSFIYKNFVWGLSNTGKVYGTLKLTLINAITGEVHIGNHDFMDKYDFNMDGRPFRDFATWVGRPGGANDGKDFLIYGYGHATVPVVTQKK